MFAISVLLSTASLTDLKCEDTKSNHLYESETINEQNVQSSPAQTIDSNKKDNISNNLYELDDKNVQANNNLFNNTRAGIIEVEPLLQNPNSSVRQHLEKSPDVEVENVEWWWWSDFTTCLPSTDTSQNVESITYPNPKLLYIPMEISSIINDGKVIYT